jgi:hypothetical protein
MYSGLYFAAKRLIPGQEQSKNFQHVYMFFDYPLKRDKELITKTVSDKVEYKNLLLELCPDLCSVDSIKQLFDEVAKSTRYFCFASDDMQRLLNILSNKPQLHYFTCSCLVKTQQPYWIHKIRCNTTHASPLTHTYLTKNSLAYQNILGRMLPDFLSTLLHYHRDIVFELCEPKSDTTETKLKINILPSTAVPKCGLLIIENIGKEALMTI